MNQVSTLAIVVVGLLGNWVIADGDSIQPCVAITGTNSEVTKSSYHRITSKEEWIGIWQNHKGQPVDPANYDTFYDPLGLPLIDFDNYMVIAVFGGSVFNSAGLVVDSISEQDEKIVFRFKAKAFQTIRTAQSATTFGFFVVPRSEKPYYLEEGMLRMRKPPIWTPRTHFPSLAKTVSGN